MSGSPRRTARCASTSRTETFTEFKSVTYKNEHGTATVYGLAADRIGNGWWLLMSQDLIDYSDIKTGKTGELKLPAETGEADGQLTAEQRKLYDTFEPPDFNTPFAWAQGPRRMGADKNGDYVWIGNSFGGNLARDQHQDQGGQARAAAEPGSRSSPTRSRSTRATTSGPTCGAPTRSAKYDPGTGKWTLFDLPTRGTETRYISLLERDGKLEVILPYSRTRKVAVMTFRSEADIRRARRRSRALTTVARRASDADDQLVGGVLKRSGGLRHWRGVGGSLLHRLRVAARRAQGARRQAPSR